MFVAGDAIEGGARAHRQFAEADNMTERLGALAALVDHSRPGARARASRLSRARFAAEPLILDKWFALQAQIPETRDARAGARADDAITPSRSRNPNRVRALIGGFTANATQFNRADGAGYEFLADIVLTLDPTNPQIAARLLTALRSWRSLEPQRQARAEAALRRIARAAEPLGRRARHRDPLARLTNAGSDRCRRSEPSANSGGYLRAWMAAFNAREGLRDAAAFRHCAAVSRSCHGVAKSDPAPLRNFFWQRFIKVWTKILTRILIVVIRVVAADAPDLTSIGFGG